MRPGMEETLRLEPGLDQKMSVWKPSMDLWMASSHEDSKILRSLRLPAKDSGSTW